MTPSQKLVERIRKTALPELPIGTTIKSLHTGRHQKSSGAFSWILWPPPDYKAAWVTNYGACESVIECLKKKKIEVLRYYNGHNEILFS